ncbi:MAG: TIM barrel protein [archaeon]
MKIGVKTYDGQEYIEHFTNKVDLIEILGITSEEFLKGKNIVVHCKHERFDINPADKTKEKESIIAIKTAIEVANFCNSDRIVVHPGKIENENCSKENSINLLKNIKDKRIILENMPGRYENRIFLGSTPEEMEEFLTKTNKGFCFDINHAISAAITNKLEPYSFIEQFLKLNPSQIHLGGQTLPDDTTHISFGESNIDLNKVIRILPENSEVILEVTQDIEKTEEDLKLFRQIWKETH